MSSRCRVLRTDRDADGETASAPHRILSTAIDLEYVFDSSGLKGMMMEDFDRVATNARRSTLELFSLDESASVQVRIVFSSNPIRNGVGCCTRWNGCLTPDSFFTIFS